MTTDADRNARAIADHMRAREGTGPAWGVEIEEARDGYARVAMVVRADMLNAYAMAHGGMIFALADTAFSYACNSHNVMTVAQQATITFLSAAREGERLVAEAREIALEGRTGVTEIIVRAGDRVVATFQGLSRTIGGAVIESGEQTS